MTGRLASKSATAALFLLPAFVFLAVFIVWPVLLSIQLSFYDWNGIAPVRGDEILSPQLTLWAKVVSLASRAESAA